MNEATPLKIEKPWSEKTVEEQANFEGSWTNLMCERLRNPEIRKQVIDLLVELDSGPKNALNEDDRKRKEGDDTPYYVSRTREQIEKDFDEDLEMVASHTPFTHKRFDEDFLKIYTRFQWNKKNEEDRREIMAMREVLEKTGKKFTTKHWNIVESHEKGHVLRTYCLNGSRKKGLFYSAYLNTKFREAFDFSKCDYRDDYEEFRKRYIESMHGNENNENINWDGIIPQEAEFKKQQLSYLANSMEIAERMSQIKNYFGLSGTDKFTKEHLAYAREHYIKDTDFDNDMTQFFQAITPEKEDAFIELINSAGI